MAQAGKAVEVQMAQNTKLEDVDLQEGTDKIEYDRQTTFQQAGFVGEDGTAKQQSVVFSIADYAEDVANQFSIRPQNIKLCCLDRDRKDFILGCQFLLVFGAILAYFIYELNLYLDTDSNRKEYTNTKSIDVFPLPFVYLEFEIDDFDCRVEPVLYVDGQNYSLIDSSQYWDYEDVGHKEMSYILGNFTDYKWEVIYRISNTSRGTKNEQFMILPSNYVNSTIDTGTKDTLDINVMCDLNEANKTAEDAFDYNIWYEIQHKEQLYKYDNLSNALDAFFYAADFIYSGYDVKFTYSWYTYDNRVDNTINYDYFVTSAQSTFLLDTHDDSDVIAILQVAPVATGLQTIFVTAPSLDIWKIFSLTGGMFTTVNSLIAFMVVYIVWGFDWKFFAFGGIAPTANPPDIETRKMRAYIERHMRAYVRRELDLRDYEIKILKKINKKLLMHVGLIPGSKVGGKRASGKGKGNKLKQSSRSRTEEKNNGNNENDESNVNGVNADAPANANRLNVEHDKPKHEAVNSNSIGGMGNDGYDIANDKSPASTARTSVADHEIKSGKRESLIHHNPKMSHKKTLSVGDEASHGRNKSVEVSNIDGLKLDELLSTLDELEDVANDPRDIVVTKTASPPPNNNLNSRPKSIHINE